MGLNKAIEAARATIPSNEIVLRLTRHEWDKVLEALPVLVKAKQRRLKELAEEYRLQRATLGQEINDINKLIQKIREKL